MKKVFIVFVLFFSCIIKGQIKGDFEYFEIKKFEENNPNKNSKEFVLDNGNKILQFTGIGGIGFVEQITRDDSKYSSVRIYYPNGILQKQEKRFYNFSIGISNQYNESGQLIKEINEDKDYKFSLEDLGKKMKDDYNIDIFNIENVFILSRYVEKQYLQISLYELWIWDNNNKVNFTCYLIDGTKGDVLFIKKRSKNDKKGSLLQQYVETFKKKQQEDNIYYKTYNGKDYTKKEWEVFEEEWYKNYKENKNKGF